jgi:glycerol-3-phosphate dehydrogenase
MDDTSWRERTSRNLRIAKFDLLIIGGGITGVGIALDAALRGMKTALVEKNDFAYGTSSRSTKLIHGGLRYLKQLEFGLVKEVGSERAIVHRLAPNLVIPEKMLLPLYEKRGFGSLLTSLGLKLYDWLAGVKREDQRKMLSRRETLDHEPLLRREDIKGGALYAEYRTDDARLTIEIMKTAAANGAQVLNYCIVNGFLYQEDKICGVRVSDLIGGTEFEIKASVVVSAAGPWVDELREIDHSKTGKHLHLTKGVHLVLPRQKLPIRQAIYFDVGDGRMIFAIPRGRTTYIGTTDTNYAGKIDDVSAFRDDAEYLIRAVNQAFENTALTLADIESSWAGLRPLVHEEGKSASELSRRDEIFESPRGLVSIAGGKLTGYRKMAERVVDLVVAQSFHSDNLKPCQTESASLVRSEFGGYGDVLAYQATVAGRLRALGLPEERAEFWVANFGKQTDLILADLVPGATLENVVLAELRFTLAHERVMKPLDFFVRRTGMLYFYKPEIGAVTDAVLSAFQHHFGWTDDQMKKEKEQLEMSIIEVTNFKTK